jgi:outer membrane protein, multidrug efflux system
LRLAEARQQTTVLFLPTIDAGAFRRVSDALVAYDKIRIFRAQQELLFRSAQEATRFSYMRCAGGVTGYLEVLINEPMPSRRSSASCRHGSMNCWVWFSCTKH